MMSPVIAPSRKLSEASCLPFWNRQLNEPTRDIRMSNLEIRGKTLAPQSPNRPMLRRHGSSFSLRSVQSVQRIPGVQTVKTLARRASKVSLSVSKAKVNDKELLENDEVLKHYTSCSPPNCTKTLTPDLKDSVSSSSHSSSQSWKGHSTTQLTTPDASRPNHKTAAASAQRTTSNTLYGMGQQNSVRMKRKTGDVLQKVSLNDLSNTPESSIAPPKQSPAKENVPPNALDRRPSSVKVPIPRRRSSLTLINMDSSHFETNVPGQARVRHRASTLTSTFRQESLSPSNTTPLDRDLTRDTLSPPLPGPASGNAVTSNRSSVSSLKPPHIYFPKTFPSGEIKTPKPPLGDIHYNCYVRHRRMPRSSNKLCPVPCMTCGAIEGEIYWKCVWCCLRICGEVSFVCY